MKHTEQTICLTMFWYFLFSSGQNKSSSWHFSWSLDKNSAQLETRWGWSLASVQAPSYYEGCPLSQSQCVMVFWWCQECCQRVWDTRGVVTTRHLTLRLAKNILRQQIVDILVSELDLSMTMVHGMVIIGTTWDWDAVSLCCQETDVVWCCHDTKQDVRPQMTPGQAFFGSYKWYTTLNTASCCSRLYLETIKVSLWTKLTDLDLIYKIYPPL